MTDVITVDTDDTRLYRIGGTLLRCQIREPEADFYYVYIEIYVSSGFTHLCDITVDYEEDGQAFDDAFAQVRPLFDPPSPRKGAWQFLEED